MRKGLHRRRPAAVYFKGQVHKVTLGEACIEGLVYRIRTQSGRMTDTNDREVFGTDASSGSDEANL